MLAGVIRHFSIAPSSKRASRSPSHGFPMPFIKPFAKEPAEWFGTVRVTHLTVNALRAVASLEFGPATAGRDD